MSGPIVKHVPSIAEVIADPSVRFQLKKWIQEAIDADPVDAYQDAVLLAEVLKRRLNETPGRWPSVPPKGGN